VRITFICNQNQARSQFLSAIFSQLLSAHNFESFGLIAQEGTQLPLVIESVFKDMGLDPVGRFARNMGLHWDEVQRADIVIAVTSLIANEVVNRGFTGQLIDLEIEAAKLRIELVDPQFMPRRQCAFELTKYLKVSFSALQRQGCIKNTQTIKAYIPERETSISNALEQGMAEKNKGSVMIYGDLVAPRNDLFDKYLESSAKYRFNGSTISVDLAASQNSKEILLPGHAVIWPCRVYLSAAWFSLFELTQVEEIILITPPLKNRSGMVAESYLAALNASDLRIVE
jgi:protein-tyrosine-phosphatase